MRAITLILAVSVLGMGVIGCDMLTKSEDTTVNYAQTVIYTDAGEPIQVLAQDGTTYVAVSSASNELLAQRGLVRINGIVRKVE